MRIDSAALAAQQHLDPTPDTGDTERGGSRLGGMLAAQSRLAEHSGSPNAGDHAAPDAHAPLVAGGNLFATLGEPALRVEVQRKGAAEAQQTDASPLRQDAERRGIIVIGGKDAPATVSSPFDALKQRPMLGGIIIVGGSDPGGAHVQGSHARDAASSKVHGPADQLGSFSLQQMLATFTQNQSLAATAQKKSDDATDDIRRKLG